MMERENVRWKIDGNNIDRFKEIDKTNREFGAISCIIDNLECSLQLLRWIDIWNRFLELYRSMKMAF